MFKICKYITIIYTIIKFFFSLNGKGNKQSNKGNTSRMFNANDISARSYVLSDFSVCRLAPKLLQNHPDTKYVRKDKCHTLGRKLRIFKIDSSVLRLPDLVSSCVTKFAGQHSALVRVFQFPSSDSYSTCLNLTRTSYPNPTRK